MQFLLLTFEFCCDRFYGALHKSSEWCSSMATTASNEFRLRCCLVIWRAFYWFMGLMAIAMCMFTFAFSIMRLTFWTASLGALLLWARGTALVIRQRDTVWTLFSDLRGARENRRKIGNHRDTNSHVITLNCFLRGNHRAGVLWEDEQVEKWRWLLILDGDFFIKKSIWQYSQSFKPPVAISINI